MAFKPYLFLLLCALIVIGSTGCTTANTGSESEMNWIDYYRVHRTPGAKLIRVLPNTMVEQYQDRYV